MATCDFTISVTCSANNLDNGSLGFLNHVQRFHTPGNPADLILFFLLLPASCEIEINALSHDMYKGLLHSNVIQAIKALKRLSTITLTNSNNVYIIVYFTPVDIIAILSYHNTAWLY